MQRRQDKAPQLAIPDLGRGESEARRLEHDAERPLSDRERDHYNSIVDAAKQILTEPRRRGGDERDHFPPDADERERLALCALYESRHGAESARAGVTLTALARRDRLEMALAVLRPVLVMGLSVSFPEGRPRYDALTLAIDRLRREIEHEILDQDVTQQQQRDEGPDDDDDDENDGDGEP